MQHLSPRHRLPSPRPPYFCSKLQCYQTQLVPEVERFRTEEVLIRTYTRRTINNEEESMVKMIKTWQEVNDKALRDLSLGDEIALGVAMLTNVQVFMA